MSSLTAHHVSLGLLALGALFLLISTVSSYQQIPKASATGSDLSTTDSKVTFKSAKTAAGLDLAALVFVVAGIVGVAWKCKAV